MIWIALYAQSPGELCWCKIMIKVAHAVVNGLRINVLHEVPSSLESLLENLKKRFAIWHAGCLKR